VNRRDLDAILAHFHADVVFDASRVMEGTYSGRSEYRRFLEDLLLSTELHWTPTSIEGVGDHVVAVATVSGAGTTSEAPVERTFAFRYWVEEGLIRRQEVYPDVDAVRGEVERDGVDTDSGAT
jgi:ketosteroid isomerase-like protein